MICGIPTMRMVVMNPELEALIPPTTRQLMAVRFLLTAGLVGPLFFFIVVLVEGTTRPGYNAWHHTMSSLALGPQGWVLTTALLVLGALLLCFAAGLRRVLDPGRGSTWGPILIAVTGLGLIVETIFPTDPILGYPPGASATLTPHGLVHHLMSLFEAPPIVAACIVLAHRFARAPEGRPWMLYSIATIIVVVAFSVLAALAGLSTDPGSPVGLFQRLEFFTAVGWIALLAGRLLTGPAL